MDAIIYYSNTKESYNVAKFISLKNNYQLLNILKLDNYEFDNIYLIFPIHYQSIPIEIRNIIKKITAKKAVVILTYGKMSYGHVLNDVKKILNAKIVGAAYVPSKHTYIDSDTSFDLNKLDILIDKINNDKEIIIKKTKKNIFASILPIYRHKISVKIIKTDKCINCNMCNIICNKIENGIIIDKSCNRCLKCVNNCPYDALEYKLSSIMKRYLKKKKKNDFIIY